MRLCSIIGCSNKAERNATKCSRCKKAAYRKRHPIRTSFQNLRSGAKRRGIEFSLTLEEFTGFCHKTKYHKNKGIMADSFHVDRILERGPYSLDNIQILTNSENVKKYCVWNGQDETGKNVFKTITQKPDLGEGLPF